MSRQTELVIPCEAAYLELIGQYVTFVALHAGFTEREVARIRLAVDEAASNVVLHAPGNGGSFRIICEAGADALTIRIRDKGPMFDLDNVPVPDLEGPIEKRRVGGLGVYLMRQVMDAVELRALDEGKEIVLVKCLAGAEGAAHAD